MEFFLANKEIMTEVFTTVPLEMAKTATIIFNDNLPSGLTERNFT